MARVSTNASYYRMIPGDERHHINDTGCGNTMNLSHPRVLQMVMDSLRYWASAFNIDGFRFDLGVTLGREATGFDPSAGFFDALRQDPLLSQRKLIMEPWDIGPGGYQLGNHPPGFGEWNDRFPRHSAPFLARRRGTPTGSRRAPDRIGRSVQPTFPANRGRRSISWRRTTASRSPIWCPTQRSTTKRTRKKTRTATTRISARTGASKAPATTPGIVETRAPLSRAR